MQLFLELLWETLGCGFCNFFHNFDKNKNIPVWFSFHGEPDFVTEVPNVGFLKTTAQLCEISINYGETQARDESIENENFLTFYCKTKWRA